MESTKKQHYYAAVHRDNNVRKGSSSGGAFTAITDSWFEEYSSRAVVYGCVMDENMKVVHCRAENTQQRDAMRGSKYVESDMSGVMRQVRDDLEKGLHVAFSGTPCQIAGLQSYLHMKGLFDESHLLTIEVICHGVGSVRFFQDYLLDWEKRLGKTVKKCNFRGKCRLGKKTQMVLYFTDGTVYESPSVRYDGFYSAYYGNMILRPSCYQCRYAQQTRFADVTIADYCDLEGQSVDSYSLIIANSVSGVKIVQAALKQMNYKHICADMIHQLHMNAPSQKPEGYDRFWEAYRSGGYNGAQQFLGNCTLKGKVRCGLAHAAYWLHADEIAKYLRIILRRMREKKR